MDELMVLTSTDGQRLAKVIRQTIDGIEVAGYEAGVTFEATEQPVGCLDDIEEVLWHLSRDPHSCVIRGALRDDAKHNRFVNRCQHVQADGRQPHWDHARPGRRWVAFDIDKMPCEPPDLLTEAYLQGLATKARARLPEPFASAGCVYKLSSSAGLDGWQTASMHLWFWLDRSVFDLSWREWASGVAVDSSLFKAVQPHYTADPVFVGMADPLAGIRIGRLPGLETVECPPELMGWAAWKDKHDAEIEARKAEIAAAKARIVGQPEQSQSATRRYAMQALDGMVSDILSAPVGDRHGTLVTKAYKLGGYVQDGFLAQHEAHSALAACVVVVFPAKRHRDELRAVGEMLAAGMKAPLDLSHIGRKPRLAVVKPAPDDDIPMPEPGSATAKKKQPVPARKKGIEWVDLDEKGKILSTAPNFAALTDWMGYKPKRNLMSHQTEWEGAPPDIALECRQNAMAGVIIDEALRHGWRMSKDNFWMHLGVVEARRAFHPVVDWVTSKPWDGVSRFDALFSTLTIREGYEHAKDLLRTQLEKWLLSGGKCLALGNQSPDGVAAQGVLVIQGPQNLGKTRWFKAMLPDSSWFSEGLTMDPSNKDHVIQGTATFICELGELDATTRKSDVAQLKAFLTRSVDVYRSPYGRQREVYARRTIFGATVNPDSFLVDDTGNRRFWVVPVSAVNADHGIDMQQVWAEAMHRAHAGEPYWLPDEYKGQQLSLASRFEARSEWADDFFRLFRLPVGDERGEVMRVSDVRSQMLPDRNWTMQDMRSFTQFLTRIKAKTSVRQGVNHVVLVRW
jgi:predicted P-loop ATPase